MQEWLNWQHWKCCVPFRVPWVRIPPFPPFKIDSRERESNVASGSAQGLCCEPRQTGNRATVAITSCVAVKSEASFFLKGPSPEAVLSASNKNCNPGTRTCPARPLPTFVNGEAAFFARQQHKPAMAFSTLIGPLFDNSQRAY